MANFTNYGRESPLDLCEYLYEDPTTNTTVVEKYVPTCGYNQDDKYYC